MGADPSEVREVCSKLDPSNPAHWTTQGVPRMDVLAGMGLTITRQELNEAYPGFTRATAAGTHGSAGAYVAPVLPEAVKDPHFAHMLKVSQRRKAALEYLLAGGFTPADLQPVTSPLQRRIAQQNIAGARWTAR